MLGTLSLVFILDSINITTKIQDFTRLTEVMLKSYSTLSNDGGDQATERGLLINNQEKYNIPTIRFTSKGNNQNIKF